MLVAGAAVLPWRRCILHRLCMQNDHSHVIACIDLDGSAHATDCSPLILSPFLRSHWYLLNMVLRRVPRLRKAWRSARWSATASTCAGCCRPPS